MKAHPETRIGHVHLKVADIDTALSFYRDILGFEVTQIGRFRDAIAHSASFLSLFTNPS